MADPLGIGGIHPLQPVRPAPQDPTTGPTTGPDGKSFKDVLLESLQQVNQLQQEAQSGVQKLVTGETDNMAEVFTAVRKADVAFSMLMEMRNKLIEAYREVQQMRV